MVLGGWTSMVIPLIVDSTLLTIVPIVSFFPPYIFNFSERCYWIVFLLFAICGFEGFNYGDSDSLW